MIENKGMNLDLSDKTVLITGGLGAIAEFVVKALHEAGAAIIVTDRITADAAGNTLSAWGLEHLQYIQMDVTDPGSVERGGDSAFEVAPGINVALGHAGGTGIHPFETCEQKVFDDLIVFNFLGQTYFARSLLSRWRKQERAGHLIFTSSYVSRIPMAGIAAYTSAKAALEMFAKNIALEYAPHGIRVNCVAPGNVAVGSSKKAYDSDPAYRAWVDRVSPLGSRNSPQAIANAFLYLCSPLADEVDGHVLQVDMGVGLPKLG